MDWTQDGKLEILRAYVELGMTYREIAERMKISYDSVEHACRRYNISLQTNASKPEKQIDKDRDFMQFLKDSLSEIKPYEAGVKNKIDSKGETLVIHLTDLHAGKLVKNQNGEVIYDESIFRERMNKLSSQILKVLDNNVSKSVAITDVVILATGDLANGEGIYATQAYEQEAAPPKQVFMIVETMVKLITALLNRKLPVRFYGIKGNHGRTGKDTDPSANWDLMCYMILDFWAKNVLKNPNLNIKYAETDYLTLDIRGHGYMIRHIAPEQADSPGGRVKINEWARMHNAEAVVFGHWHHFGFFDVDDIRVFRGGSVVGGDSLSEQMAKHSEPSQLIWGVSSDRVSTFLYAVDLVD